ncbi:hypothetical protein D3C78_1435800 [compost metagenome]
MAVRVASKPIRFATRARGRSAWRITFDMAAVGTVLSSTWKATEIPLDSTRACNGADSVRNFADCALTSGARFCVFHTRLANSENCEWRTLVLPSMTRPTCCHAASTYSSWFFCTMFVPIPAAAR